MAIELNEPIVRALVERLEAELPAAIAAVNQDVDDGIQIAEPAQVHDFLPTPNLLTVFPTIGIGDGPSTFSDDTGFSATGEHHLLVVCYLQDASQNALARQLRRYVRAVARVVLAGRRLGDAAWSVSLVRVVPGPTLADDPEDPREWMSWSGIEIAAKRDEDA